MGALIWKLLVMCKGKELVSGNCVSVVCLDFVALEKLRQHIIGYVVIAAINLKFRF